MDILIIDDDREITEMMSDFLSMFDHNVDVMNTAPESVIEKIYDVAFLDCHINDQEYMTEESNFLSKINSRHKFFFTGSPDRLVSHTVVQQVDGVVQKPVDFDTIKRLIDLLKINTKITCDDIKQLKKNGVILFMSHQE